MQGLGCGLGGMLDGMHSDDCVCGWMANDQGYAKTPHSEITVVIVTAVITISAF